MAENHAQLDFYSLQKGMSPHSDIYPDYLARILRPLVTFAEQIFFGLIMNKQECNELTLIISYVALLVSNGD
jgi:hypothetical protein